MNTDGPIDILIIEDNKGDIELTRIAFENTHFKVNLAAVHDGSEALEYLMKQNGFQDAPTPSLIFLDINMPRMDGLELLTIIKQDDRLKTIPVIMLTSSNAPSDILESYKRYANSYILKPRSIKEGTDMARQVENFWINLSQLPPIHHQNPGN